MREAPQGGYICIYCLTFLHTPLSPYHHCICAVRKLVRNTPFFLTPLQPEIPPSLKLPKETHLVSHFTLVFPCTTGITMRPVYISKNTYFEGAHSKDVLFPRSKHKKGSPTMYSSFEYKFLASAITRARKVRKLTQTQLAAACGMNQTTISRLENPDNKHSVTLATLNKVAAALGCNMRVVFKPAEAETLDLPPKKPEPTPKQEWELTEYELERLRQLSGRQLINEVARLQDEGKYAPDEFLPEHMR